MCSLSPPAWHLQLTLWRGWGGWHWSVPGNFQMRSTAVRWVLGQVCLGGGGSDQGAFKNTAGCWLWRTQLFLRYANPLPLIWLGELAVCVSSWWDCLFVYLCGIFNIINSEYNYNNRWHGYFTNMCPLLWWATAFRSLCAHLQLCILLPYLYSGCSRFSVLKSSSSFQALRKK